MGSRDEAVRWSLTHRCPRRRGNGPGTGTREVPPMRSAGYLSAQAGTTSLALTSEDVADSMVSLAETYSRSDMAGVCIADGFGVRVVVERGALEVHDGVGPQRRTRCYARATPGLRRLVIL